MTTYLVTGVNRGIGLALLKLIASNPENLLIGTVRDASKADEIEKLGFKNVKLLSLDMSLSYEEFEKSFKDLESLTPNGIDIIIHNAGVTSDVDTIFLPMAQFPVPEFEKVFNVNVLGSFKFYKAISKRLETNNKPFKLLFVSSIAAFITNMEFATNAYGASKAALNHLAKQIASNRKESGDVIIPIHPGVVDTDMTADFKDVELIRKSMITSEQSASQMLDVAHKVTIEDTGKFFSYDGSLLTI